MKLSHVVAKFIADEGIKTVFAISGGASLHLIHSIAETEGTSYACPLHEQGAAFAADGYARVTGGLGCAVTTSGPGATNLITGISSSFYDSIPILFLTGQVATFRAKGDSGVRQVGFQETDTVEICRPITKYAVLVTDPYLVLYELQKAVFIAKSGRPGPVLVDIPDDLQRMDIDPSKLVEFSPEDGVLKSNSTAQDPLEHALDSCVEALENSSRPVLIFGWGIHLANAEDDARELCRLLNIPVAATWAAEDILTFDNDLSVGGFGTHGTRYANFAVQNADLILSIGSRLDTKATGSPPSSFAREAKIIMVDIDPTEISKFVRLDRKIDLGVPVDARVFMRSLIDRLKARTLPDYSAWRNKTVEWKEKYPACRPEYALEQTVNPYYLVTELAGALEEDELIFSDTGCALAWTMQAFEFKKGQRFFHAFNNTPMGYGLPAAIGGSFARPNRRVILMTGDGSLQMSIQEMAMVVHHRLPVKIFLFNNHGHSMVRQTQEQWLGGKYYATSPEGGIACPDFPALARAYGFHTDSVALNSEMPAKIREMLAVDGPTFLNIEIDAEHRVIPQVMFGRPNEDAGPLLERQEFLSNMIVKPLPASLRE